MNIMKERPITVAKIKSPMERGSLIEPPKFSVPSL